MSFIVNRTQEPDTRGTRSVAWNITSSLPAPRESDPPVSAGAWIRHELVRVGVRWRQADGELRGGELHESR